MLSPSTTANTIAVALGTNLGDRLTNLRAAVSALAPYLTLLKYSAIYETAPAYVVDQPAFLNAAVLGTTNLHPLDVLHALKQTEMALGRVNSLRNGPRLIDLDIIFYGNQVMHTDELTLPHPRLAEREFVLRPLADIAGDWRDPRSKLTIKAMLAALPTHNARRLKDGF